MKKVGIITFHASHNYGSMLQAYALQHIVQNLGYDCEIINFRSLAQKEMYKPIFMKGTLYGRCVRFIIQLRYAFGIIKKQRLFEKFLKKELNLSSKEYSTLEELENADFNYDYYISGSDQIWNVQCIDFSYAYFLPFIKSGKKRIAYAPSLGPGISMKNHGDISKISDLLKKYDAISVREPAGAKFIENLCQKSVPAVLDPTLLLKIDEYDKLIDNKPLIKDEYVLIYSPNFNNRVYEMAWRLGQKHNIKVVLTQGLRTKGEMLKWGWQIKIYAASGPKEFLNLCKNATIICCDSFHAVVFSILFRKSFFVVNDIEDNRISNLLKITHLQKRKFSLSDDFLSAPLQIDFTDAFNYLEMEKTKSMNWLKQSLGNQ